MHRIRLATVVIDVPSGERARTVHFWAAALGATARQGVTYPEYHVLENEARRAVMMVQDVNDAPARMHIDIETDDVLAEVARLLRVGATEVERHDDWVVLRDPAGLLFCVVPADSPDFEARSTTVE